MADIPPARQEYTVEEIVKEGKVELFAAFEKKYRLWIRYKLLDMQYNSSVMSRTMGPSFLYLRERVYPETFQSPNFNLYKGELERACAAAKHLAPRYDLGVGIAKKGLWLSFIFSLYGVQSYDCLVLRDGERRSAHHLGYNKKKDALKKKILIFDNDAVTGLTIKSAAKHLSAARPELIDALLIYARTELKPEYYDQIKSQFKNNPTVLGERDGVVVIDTRSEVQPHVRKVMTLQTDYEPRPELLTGLAKKLGVNYEPKA